MEHRRSEMPQIRARLAALRRVEMTVGVHQSENAAPDGTSRALIASVHEYGSDTVPARPYMQPGVDEHRGELTAYMRRVARMHVLRGVPLRPALSRVGLQVESWIRARIDSNIPPPLSEATLEQRRSKLASNGGQPRNNRFGGFTALRDTSTHLYNALRHVVRDRGGA